MPPAHTASSASCPVDVYAASRSNRSMSSGMTPKHRKEIRPELLSVGLLCAACVRGFSLTDPGPPVDDKRVELGAYMATADGAWRRVQHFSHSAMTLPVSTVFSYEKHASVWMPSNRLAKYPNAFPYVAKPAENVAEIL